MSNLIVKIKKLVPEARLPQYAHPGDAALDLFSVEKFILNVGERHAFKTGIASEFPAGYFVQFAPKSGLAVKDGIDVLGGVLDSSYRGEWLVILINHGNKPKEFDVGDKLAQAILFKIGEGKIVVTEELSSSERGEGGFGSTGK